MRKIDADIIKNTVKQLFLDCNYYIGEDIGRTCDGADL